MRIRSQLALMMAAVIAPVAGLALAALVALQHVQRDAEAQRLLERVSALRLALDTEIAGTQRVLRTVADGDGDAGPALPARLERLLRANPMWTSIGIVGADGHERVRVDRPGAPPRHRLDTETLARALHDRAPVVSNLVPADGGHMTYVAVPGSAGVAFVGIEAGGWLAFLRSHVIVAGATLTLTDRDGRIVARTLNHEAWVGRLPLAEYLAHIQASDQGSFFSTGLERQSFQSAFSRLRGASWVLGSGVPTELVTGALAVPASMIVGGLVLAAVTAGLLALLFGRRVTVSFDRLAALARAPAAPDGGPGARLPIDEAEDARRLLRQALDNESRARADAERANRAKDEFLAMLAHELRNPLSAITAAATLLHNPKATPQTDRRAREILLRQTGHMAALVDEMLDAARLNSGKVTLDRRPTDLAEVVRRVLEAFADAGRTAHVAVHAALAPAPVDGDDTRLEQIVANLLDNAAKFTPRGGTVRLAAGPDPDDAAQVRLRIDDDGSGIPPALLPHVFDAFSQAERAMDRSQGGLGLGLNVVRRLVELHGGTVTANSAGPGRGARFTVRLPRHDGAAGQAEAAPAAALAPMHIALVEDNQDSRDMVGTLLQAAGHRVGTAPDGEAGLALILEARPALALVDLSCRASTGWSSRAACARHRAATRSRWSR